MQEAAAEEHGAGTGQPAQAAQAEAGQGQPPAHWQQQAPRTPAEEAEARGMTAETQGESAATAAQA